MASANRNWAFKAPNWMRKIIRGSSTSKAGAPYSLEDLPQHTSADQSSISTTLTQVTDVTILSEPSLYLMACAHKTERRRHLLQDPIDSVSTDRALFHFMKQQLRRNQSRARQFFSMRSVQGMYFVKVSRRVCSFHCSDILEVPPANGQFRRSARPRSLLYIYNATYLRMHPTNPESGTGHKRRISLRTSRSSCQVATCTFARPHAHAILARVH